MLNIVVCDPDNKFLDTLEEKIVNYLSRYPGLEFQIVRFLDVESLLEKDISDIDIIFMGVQLQRMTGIDAATILRQKSEHFVLIFVSDFIEYAPLGYQVNALRYIIKDQLEQYFAEAMATALSELGLHKNKINIKFIGCAEKEILTDNIIYIESNLHKVHFRLTNSDRSLYLYDTLNEIQNKLAQDYFIRIHQSYLVNLKHLIKAKNYKATLTQGIELPISQRCFSKVKQQLLVYKESV